MHIRAARLSDQDWIVSQFPSLDRFFNLRYPLFHDSVYVRASVNRLIEEHFVRIASEKGVNLGFIAGMIVPHMFEPKLQTLVELFWWVGEGVDERAEVGLLLMDEFVKWGRENVNLMTFSLQQHSPVGKRALERRGFRLRQLDYYSEVS